MLNRYDGIEPLVLSAFWFLSGYSVCWVLSKDRDFVDESGKMFGHYLFRRNSFTTYKFEACAKEHNLRVGHSLKRQRVRCNWYADTKKLTTNREE